MKKLLARQNHKNMQCLSGVLGTFIPDSEHLSLAQIRLLPLKGITEMWFLFSSTKNQALCCGTDFNAPEARDSI